MSSCYSAHTHTRGSICTPMSAYSSQVGEHTVIQSLLKYAYLCAVSSCWGSSVWIPHRHRENDVRSWSAGSCSSDPWRLFSSFIFQPDPTMWPITSRESCFCANYRCVCELTCFLHVQYMDVCTAGHWASPCVCVCVNPHVKVWGEGDSCWLERSFSSVPHTRHAFMLRKPPLEAAASEEPVGMHGQESPQ